MIVLISPAGLLLALCGEGAERVDRHAALGRPVWESLWAGGAPQEPIRLRQHIAAAGGGSEVRCRVTVAAGSVLSPSALGTEPLPHEGGRAARASAAPAEMNVVFTPLRDATGEVRYIVGSAIAAGGAAVAAEAAADAERPGHTTTAADVTDARRSGSALTAARVAYAGRPEAALAAARPAEGPDRLVHQANNCVNGVKTALAVLRDAITEGSEDERLLELMDRDLDRLAALVRQLYDLSGGPGERR